MKASHAEAVMEIRDAGYVVVIWSAGELAGVDPEHFENRVIELGNEVIDNLSQHKEQP